MRKRPRCEHHCACGSIHICGDFDRCIVPQSNEPYVCPACDLDAMDEYLNRLQPATEPATEQEKDHESI